MDEGPYFGHITWHKIADITMMVLCIIYMFIFLAAGLAGFGMRHKAACCDSNFDLEPETEPMLKKEGPNTSPDDVSPSKKHDDNNNEDKIKNLLTPNISPSNRSKQGTVSPQTSVPPTTTSASTTTQNNGNIQQAPVQQVNQQQTPPQQQVQNVQNPQQQGVQNSQDTTNGIINTNGTTGIGVTTPTMSAQPPVHRITYINTANGVMPCTSNANGMVYPNRSSMVIQGLPPGRSSSTVSSGTMGSTMVYPNGNSGGIVQGFAPNNSRPSNVVYPTNTSNPQYQYRTSTTGNNGVVFPSNNNTGITTFPANGSVGNVTFTSGTTMPQSSAPGILPPATNNTNSTIPQNTTNTNTTSIGMQNASMQQSTANQVVPQHVGNTSYFSSPPRQSANYSTRDSGLMNKQSSIPEDRQYTTSPVPVVQTGSITQPSPVVMTNNMPEASPENTTTTTTPTTAYTTTTNTTTSNIDTYTTKTSGNIMKANTTNTTFASTNATTTTSNMNANTNANTNFSSMNGNVQDSPFVQPAPPPPSLGTKNTNNIKNAKNTKSQNRHLEHRKKFLDDFFIRFACFLMFLSFLFYFGFQCIFQIAVRSVIRF